MTETQAAEGSSRVRFEFDDAVHGSGGFARVIKGKDNVLQRDVAIKVLNSLAETFDSSDQERFRREARMLASLSHPNIPSIYDVLVDEDTFLILFQFINGITLENLIQDEGPAEIGQVRSWFQQISSALDHAHDSGIIHRDVKPANIIITPDYQSAYLVDFGIAISKEDAQRLTESGYVIGTAGYMSPEQQGGEEIDARSDIFSLGVTMYEALAGRQLPQGQYEELSLVNEAIPPEIDDLIQECLLRREQRIESAKTFSERLAGALRTSKPLSETLTHGRLHEIAFALEPLNATEFIGLPTGQRTLILAKVVDIVSSDDVQLQYPAQHFLDLLLTRGLLLSQQDYREVVTPAIQLAFGSTGFSSTISLRRAIESAARHANAEAHDTLSSEFITFLEDADLDEAEGWYLLGSRDILQA